MLQPKLPFRNVGLLYECSNTSCFYDGALLKFDEVVWKHYYNHEMEDLDMRSTCPACGDPMMIWHDTDEDTTETVPA